MEEGRGVSNKLVASKLWTMKDKSDAAEFFLWFEISMQSHDVRMHIS